MVLPQQRLTSMSLGEVFGEALHLYAKHWAQYLAISAVAVVPFSVMALALDGAVSDPATDSATALGAVVVAGAVGLILTLALEFVVTGALTRSAVSEMAGQPIGAVDGLRNGMLRIGGLLWVIVLGTVALAALGGALFLSERFIGVAGPVLAVVAIAVGGTVISVAVPAFVVEDVRARAALSRSWGLVKPHFFHALVVVFVSRTVANVIDRVISALLDGRGGSSLAGEWAVSSVGLVLATPFVALVPAVLYVELRARQAGITAGTLRDDLTRTSV